MRCRVACSIALVLAACVGGDVTPPSGGRTTPASPAASPAPLVAMPSGFLVKCTRFEELRPACPALVPEVADSRFERSHVSPEGRVWIFVAQWNAPYPRITEKNAPPRFAHVNVFAGDLQAIAGFDVAGDLEGAPPPRRTDALSLGTREWNGRIGELLLAPSYPSGGMEGDHLVYRWEDEVREYSLSLHAWEPLDVAEETLRQMVESLP